MKSHTHEIAGKTKAIAMALAKRHGYGEPTFIIYSGGLCVLRFEARS
ncbi:hypothetical protein WG219_09890 [Ectopseudomonas mendocina]|uniref:Uncharacterized protein n=1 Tax=Ectopseudomonas mendocina TaxID=300 RepID=A0ABZ2RNQ7_ECTME